MVGSERNLPIALQTTLHFNLWYASSLRSSPNRVVVSHLSSIHPHLPSTTLQKHLRTLPPIVETTIQADCQPLRS